ncbi:hypothetical protein ACFFU2_11360 [Halomonas alkalicola]|uniref:PspC domain-containing protein n=1 Tax=Halomonas alkalicola TaxID=1930622 RepID=A0ABY9H570_9GAMM|nr:hypothetical protein [Halomonas alkalicola]WLI73622.1 hypothetical protein B6N23_01385 [Halomonas alkalicola]
MSVNDQLPGYAVIMDRRGAMNFFFGFLRACEVINRLICRIAWLFFKVLLLTPVWIIGFIIYQLLF